MARKNIHIPSGGRIDSQFLDSLNEQYATKVRTVRLKLSEQ